MHRRIPVKIALPPEYYEVLKRRFIEEDEIIRVLSTNLEGLFRSWTEGDISYLDFASIFNESYLPHIFRDAGLTPAEPFEKTVDLQEAIVLEIFIKRKTYNEICEGLPGEGRTQVSLSNFVFALITKLEAGEGENPENEL